MMIRVVNEKDRQMWVSEQYLEEMKRIEEAHKSKWSKELKFLIMQIAEELTKLQNWFTEH